MSWKTALDNVLNLIKREHFSLLTFYIFLIIFNLKMLLTTVGNMSNEWLCMEHSLIILFSASLSLTAELAVVCGEDFDLWPGWATAGGTRVVLLKHAGWMQPEERQGTLEVSVPSSAAITLLNVELQALGWISAWPLFPGTPAYSSLVILI